MDINSSTTPVTPQQQPIAPEDVPQPRFSKSTSVEYSITNHSILQTIAKKYNTSTELPDAPTIKSATSFYAKLNTSEQIEVDFGYEMQIEVQSDMRYITHYLMFTTALEYPDFDIKGYSYVSLPSLVVYKLAVFIGHFLIGDLKYRISRSSTASPFTNDSYLMEYLSLLQACPVPEDVQTFLNLIAPVKDSQRHNLRFIPSFAAFSFFHDFGFSVPITAFLEIHDILASNRTNTDPSIIMTKIYNSKLIVVNDTSYTISNLFAGPFSNDNEDQQHRNWFSTELESFINPVVTRALVQRPTFSKIKTVALTVPSPDKVNGYFYLLGNPEQNGLLLSNLFKDITRFYSDNQKRTLCLGTMYSSSSSLNIMSHSIEPYVLPTHHKLSIIKLPDSEKEIPPPTILSDDKYANLIKLCTPRPNFTGTFKIPEEGSVLPDLYRAINEKYDPNMDPTIYRTFSVRKHIIPNVFWFQPYDKARQSIEIALTAGFKIIQEEIDGIIIPLPNTEKDLSENNSLYLQGSVPTHYIRPYVPDCDDKNHLVITERTPHKMQTQPLGFGIRNGSINSLPVLGETNVSKITDTPNGFTLVVGWNNYFSSPSRMDSNNLIYSMVQTFF